MTEIKVKPMDIKYVKTSDIKESPIRHLELPGELITRIYAFKEKLSEVELMTIEKTINNFKCDRNPENELRIWERIANAYTQYLHDNPSTELSFKKDVYSVLLRLTMGVSDFHDVKLTNEQINDLFAVIGITREVVSIEKIEILRHEMLNRLYQISKKQNAVFTDILNELKKMELPPMYPLTHEEAYKEARNIVVQYRLPYISLIQRLLGIGYARAANIMFQLEADGVVGPADGAMREILIARKDE